MKLFLSLFAIVIISLTGCNSKDTIASLSATKWKLKGYVTAEDSQLRAIECDDNEDNFRLEFMNKVQTYGWGEKNSIGGKYKVAGTNISFEELVYTQATTQLDYEDIFFELIENASEYAIQNKELYLYSDDKKSYLVFEKI